VFADKRLLLRTAEALPAVDSPALVVWAAGDRVMQPEHGRRLATLLPNALLEIPDSYTLVPLDQPAQMAEAIRGANDRRPRATPGHVQPFLLRPDRTSGYNWHHPATLRKCLLSCRSRVRVAVGAQVRGIGPRRAAWWGA
jgi:hypothetical protein